jgi:ribosomal protein S18 acetylase RimI-like enzyme
MGIISPADIVDGPVIMAIAERAGVFDASEVSTVAELWGEYLEKGPQTSGYHFIDYREQNTVLGFACYGPRALTEGTYDVYWIAVDASLRGRGLGQALMSGAEADIRSSGGRLVIVETSGTPKYEPTRRFYISAGYTQEAVLRDFYHPGDDLVIFTKHL